MNGKMDFVMALDLKPGQMVPATLDNGKITKLVDMVSSLTLKATLTKGNGQMTKPMDTEFISMLMEPSIRVIGKMTCNTDSVSKLGLINRNTKESTVLDENMD